MLANYFKVLFRSLLRNRFIAAINILSLALGFAGVTAIFFYVRHELGVDSHFENANRIYRLTYDETAKIPNGRYLATTSPPMGPALVSEYPEVEKAVRLRTPHNVILKNGDRQFYENGLVYADPDFFNLFDFTLAQGDPQTALRAPNTIVLTPELAARYFGNENPMGKNLLLDDQTALTVSGILAEAPKQSHLKFDGLISFSTFKVPYGYPVNLQSWGWISFHTYLMLRGPEDAVSVHQKLGDFFKKNVSPDRAARAELKLQPLSDIYFHSGTMLNSQDNANGNLTYVYGLSLVAFLLMLVAGFNYMNIAMARSIRKGKEVGVRKVLGAGKRSIIWQFLSESIIIALMSLLLGLLLFNLFQPLLFEAFGIGGTHLTWSEYIKGSPIFLLIAVTIGVLAGLYPSIIQSRFASIEALKGKLKTGKSSLNIRKGLIISQFIVTSALIAATLLVQKQMKYIQNKALGFASEEVLALQMQSPDFLDRYPQAKQILLQNAYVRQVSAGDILDDHYGSVPIVPEGFSREETSAMHLLGGYMDYYSTLGVKMLAGRDFSSVHPTDTNAIILNQSAALAFGWTAEEAIDKQIEVNNSHTGPVIGVTEDFHYKSLHDPIQPLVTVVPRTRMEYFLVRINTADVQSAIAGLGQDWLKIAPELPFTYSFVNEDIDLKYKTDERFLQLISLFSTLAILLACMGLYGLISTLIEYRIREIGIRKVMGASVLQISSLLGQQFLLLLLLANIFAIPLAVWGGQYWLEGFTYRISIGWSIFAISVIITILMALLSIGFQTLKAAMSNPVEALKEQ